jgi:predicted secreted protein
MNTTRSLCILLTVALFSCSHPTELNRETGISLDASVNGTTVSYPPGQSFSLDLEVFADAGYTWECTISEESVLAMERDPSYRPKYGGPILPGGATIETFYFRTAGFGKSTMTLIEHQGWMKDVPPIVTVQFTVIVM